MLAADDPPALARRRAGAASTSSTALDVQEAALRAGGRPGGPGLGRRAARRRGAGCTTGRARGAVPTEPGDYPAFYAGMARALREGGPPPVDPADAVAVLEVIEAARRSAAEPVPRDIVAIVA